MKEEVERSSHLHPEQYQIAREERQTRVLRCTSALRGLLCSEGGEIPWALAVVERGPLTSAVTPPRSDPSTGKEVSRITSLRERVFLTPAVHRLQSAVTTTACIACRC